MVLFSADGEDDLHKISYHLTVHGIKHHMFYEPDINAFTSIATKPLRGEQRKLMRRFKLKK